jgi:hypothetical protein
MAEELLRQLDERQQRSQEPPSGVQITKDDLLFIDVWRSGDPRWSDQEKAMHVLVSQLGEERVARMQHKTVQPLVRSLLTRFENLRLRLGGEVFQRPPLVHHFYYCCEKISQHI